MSYAIISVGGKQYRVREGERLLVDRLALEDGASFTPTVLLTGGGGEPELAPAAVVTAKVLSQEKGPKIRIGKYKQRTGYKRHTGFRASLTRIQIESIGGAPAKRERTTQKPQTLSVPPAEAPSALPAGYSSFTVAQIREAAPTWDAAALAAALEHETTHGKRKGAIAALEAAIAEES